MDELKPTLRALSVSPDCAFLPHRMIIFHAPLPSNSRHVPEPLRVSAGHSPRRISEPTARSTEGVGPLDESVNFADGI